MTRPPVMSATVARAIEAALWAAAALLLALACGALGHTP